jgi:hypothetical protein
MSLFYAGRLWTTPAVMSSVNDSAMFNPNTDVGNVLAVIGQSVAGQPNTPLAFISPEDARTALVSGDLLDAVVRAFDPSAETSAPATIIAMRVNPATASTLVLLSGAAASVITLTAGDYGLRTNQIKVKVETATNLGLKLTTQFGSAYYSQDDVGRNAFAVQYTGGGASARMSVTNAAVTLESPNSTVVASIDLNSYQTIQQVVDRINATAGFVATVTDGNGSAPALNGLDSVSLQDVKTASYQATAHLQAAVDWFNGAGEGYVNAVRTAGAGAVPAVLPFTYLAGGADGTVTNTEWSNAFTALQTVDTQWVVPLSSSPSIAAMADAHCAYMSNVARKERRAICGTALGTSDIQAIAAAKAINSDRTSLVHLGIWDYDVTGALVLYAPYITAAMVAGAFSGINPGTPLTNKSLKVRGVERKLRNPTDTDALINGGVLCLQSTSTGYRVVKSISTWLTNKNFNRVEQSVGTALDFVCRTVRDAVADLKGAKASPATLGLAGAKVETALRGLATPEPNGPGVIVGDANSPAYKNITVSLQGDVLAIAFQCSPVIPVNFIPVTVFAVPFSGSITL